MYQANPWYNYALLRCKDGAWTEKELDICVAKGRLAAEEKQEILSQL